MELTDYVRVFRRNWRLILAATLAVVAVAAVVTTLAPREYRAQTQLFVSTAGGDSVSDLAQGGTFTQRQVATYADIVTTPIVLEQVVADLELDETTRSLAGRVTATVPPNTVLIDVAVIDRDPARAAEIANATAEQFAATLQDLERTDATGRSPVKATVVQPATAPAAPSSPNPLRNIALATVLGALLGAGLAVLRDLLDTRIRGDADVTRVTQEPVLGAIVMDADASSHPLVLDTDPHSHRAEAFRALRTNLQFLDVDDDPRVLVMTSTVPGEGKTTTTANLALTLVAADQSVCLIEGDLRRPRLLQYLGLDNAVGLSDVLVGRASLEDVLQPHVRGLRVLGSGMIPPNPSELLGSGSMRRLVGQLREQFDYVLIDSPPLMPVTDAAVLSTVAEGTIVVVGAGIARRDQLARVLHALERVDANVLGLVLNRLPAKGPDAYTDGYAAYVEDPVDERALPARPRSRTRARTRRRDAVARG